MKRKNMKKGETNNNILKSYTLRSSNISSLNTCSSNTYSPNVSLKDKPNNSKSFDRY